MGSSKPPAGPLVPRSRYLLALAAVALVVSLLQWSHLVELPLGFLGGGEGSVISSASLGDLMSSAGYAGLFALMVLESASLPVPSEIVLPLAGYLVSIHVMDFWTAVAVSTVASLVGALIDYYIALKLGRPFVVRAMRVFRVHEGSLDRAEKWFEKSGQWTVFAARFVPVLRTVISLPAGLFRMGLKPFVAMTVAGCLIWSIFLIYAGFLAGSAWSGALDSSSAAVDVLSAVVAFVAAGYVVYYASPYVRRRQVPSQVASAA